MSTIVAKRRSAHRSVLVAIATLSLGRETVPLAIFLHIRRYPLRVSLLHTVSGDVFIVLNRIPIIPLPTDDGKMGIHIIFFSFANTKCLSCLLIIYYCFPPTLFSPLLYYIYTVGLVCFGLYYLIARHPFLSSRCRVVMSWPVPVVTFIFTVSFSLRPSSVGWPFTDLECCTVLHNNTIYSIQNDLHLSCRVARRPNVP